jgi:TolB-like protein
MTRGANHPSSQPPVPHELCRAHLEKLTSSATFARAEQLRRLVEWLGRRALTPNPVAPSEKDIGELVLGRKDFDPQTDSLVRKEMSRLRDKLAQYYAKEGARERVRIRSVGGYLFQFVWAGPAVTEAWNEGELPCLLILPVRARPDLSGQAARLVEELLMKLGEHSVAELVSPTTALSYAGRIGDIREFAAECGAHFVIEGSLELWETQLRVTLWFVNGRTGRAERAARFTGQDSDELASLAALWLREQMVRPV